MHPAPTEAGSSGCSTSVYAVVFAPQDRVVRALSGRGPGARSGGRDGAGHGGSARPSPTTIASLAFLANTGLSTQLAVLGICLAAGAPALFLWLALACLLPLPLLQLRRERLAGARHGAA